MASHTKPPKVCYLKEGRAVGAHKDFAKTFNWLVDWCWNFKVGRGLKFQHEPDSAHPKVSLDDDEGGGGGGDANITVTGTDGSSYTGKAITFKSEQYSNVHVNCSADGTVEVGVFYV